MRKNGISYIQERSNISVSELATMLEVTRQTVISWKKGTRSPSKKHLAMLSEIYGIGEEYFGNLTDEMHTALQNMKAYRHVTESGEYYNFQPNGGEEILYRFGDLQDNLDGVYGEALKQKKNMLERIDHFIKGCHYSYEEDRIVAINRGCHELERYLDVMSAVDLLNGSDGPRRLDLKVPLRYEIYSVLLAMQVAYGVASDDIIDTFVKENEPHSAEPQLGMDAEEISQLVEILQKHWKRRAEGWTRQKQQRMQHIRKSRQNLESKHIFCEYIDE